MRCFPSFFTFIFLHVGKDDNGVIKQIGIEGCLQDGTKKIPRVQMDIQIHSFSEHI